MKCLVCGNEFEARANKKYRSSKCYKAHHYVAIKAIADG